MDTDGSSGTNSSLDPASARVFGLLPDGYHRGRPSYPAEAAAWLTGPTEARILELVAGTGELTEQLTRLRHEVVACDTRADMLRELRGAVPEAHPLLGDAARLPLANRSVDVVVAAQAFHGLDPARTLPEVARVLRPGGRLALVFNARDERIPWVKRLGRLIGPNGQGDDPTPVLDESAMFETVEHATFRFWQPTTRETLLDLAGTAASVASRPEQERAEVLAQVESLYDEYGRGHDGMLLPYVTSAYRAVILPWADTQDSDDEPPVDPDVVDTDSLLIDFR